MSSPSSTSIRQQLARHWRHEFRVYQATDADSAAIRARHMQSVGHLTPIMMAGNLAGGLLLVVALYGSVPDWQLGSWLAALLGFCGAAIANWWQYRVHPRSAVSPAAISRMVRGAALIGALWIGATTVWLPLIAHSHQLLLATLVVGMMCGGAFALTSVPQAAAAFLGVMVVGSCVALLRAGGDAYLNLVVMVLLYGVVLVLCVLTTARMHTARLESERDAERQGELIGLLLRDFEEHSADLLWEIGVDGRFRHVSSRLAETLAGPPAAITASGLVEVLLRHLPLAQPDSCVDALVAALAAGRPFRDIAVPVQTASGRRWWSLTAKPLGDAGAAITGWRGVIADVTQARHARERLEHQANSDSLTGLANRYRLREQLQQRLLRVDPEGGPAQQIALICVDVDHFKAINDALGHATGDAVLVEFAARLRETLREIDLAARLGGDEFALLVDLVDGPGQAHAVARRLLRALCVPFEFDGQTIPLSASIGIAIAPDDAADLDQLLVNADLALYEAKEHGRGRYELFAARLGDRHRRRLLIAQQLRTALERGEFSLAWQPQVGISNWDIVGAEVLLRWQHPTLGHVSPAEFIPLAEESGLINPIGAWVLEQACLGAVGLAGAMSVSVNASPAQLMQEDFVSVVARALQRSGLPPRQLKIEITESLFMDAVPVALDNLHGLRQLGVQIALDDFGTGFSSLAYLLRFPFDVLKIDRAFVLEMMARDDARALVRTIAEMARTLGMGTVAEGVEDAAQLEVLRAAGCDAVQGYLVARPMSLAQLVEWLGAWRIGPHDPSEVASALLTPPSSSAALAG